MGGAINSLLGKEIAMETALLIERILEDYTDECLMIMNEEEIDEKALRNTICEIRDENYNQLQEMNFSSIQFNEQVHKYATLGFESLLRLSRKL